VSKRAKHREKLRRRMHRRVPPGAPPGTLGIDPAAPPPEIHVFAYSGENFLDRRVKNLDEIPKLLKQWPVCWFNVDGLGDAATIRRLGEIFDIHPLAQEDIVHVHQRPKVEQYGDRLFAVTHMLSLNDHLETEQISFMLGPGFVVSFQERPGWDCLEPIRERIRSPKSRLRDAGADFLLYSLIDAVIDNTFPVLEKYGERLEALEDEIVERGDETAFADMHDVKRELLHLRRLIWPERDAVAELARDPLVHVRDETRVYFRDCYDHTLRLIELVESYREIASDLTSVYLSSVSNRMNEIMKVLTVISTIFIPLTFVVGVYGMNFETDASPWNMPELNWRYGYVACLALMAAIAIGQLVFFYRKGWLGRGKRRSIKDEG
jgi:magnesium transporter